MQEDWERHSLGMWMTASRKAPQEKGQQQQYGKSQQRCGDSNALFLQLLGLPVLSLWNILPPMPS